MVITAYNAFRYYQSSDLVTEVVSTEDIGEMLQTHQKQVDEFIGKGYTPFTDFSRESAVRATDLYYRSPAPLRRLRVAGAINLGFLLLLVLAFGLLVWSAISNTTT